MWVGWGQISRSDSPQRSNLSLFVPDFLLRDPRPWRLFEHSREIGIDELLNLLANRETSGQKIEWTEPSFEDYAASFADIQARIAARENSPKQSRRFPELANIEVEHGIAGPSDSNCTPDLQELPAASVRFLG